MNSRPKAGEETADGLDRRAEEIDQRLDYVRLEPPAGSLPDGLNDYPAAPEDSAHRFDDRRKEIDQRLDHIGLEPPADGLPDLLDVLPGVSEESDHGGDGFVYGVSEPLAFFVKRDYGSDHGHDPGDNEDDGVCGQECADGGSHSFDGSADAEKAGFQCPEYGFAHGAEDLEAPAQGFRFRLECRLGNIRQLDLSGQNSKGCAKRRELPAGGGRCEAGSPCQALESGEGVVCRVQLVQEGRESCDSLESCVCGDGGDDQALVFREEDSEVRQLVHNGQEAVHHIGDSGTEYPIEDRLGLILDVRKDSAEACAQLTQLLEGGAVFADHLADALRGHAEKLHGPVFECGDFWDGHLDEALRCRGDGLCDPGDVLRHAVDGVFCVWGEGGHQVDLQIVDGGVEPCLCALPGVRDGCGHVHHGPLRIVEGIRQGVPFAHAIRRGGGQSGHKGVQGVRVLLPADGGEGGVTLGVRHVLGGLVDLPDGFFQADEVSAAVKGGDAELRHHLSGLSRSGGEVYHDGVEGVPGLGALDAPVGQDAESGPGFLDGDVQPSQGPADADVSLHQLFGGLVGFVVCPCRYIQVPGEVADLQAQGAHAVCHQVRASSQVHPGGLREPEDGFKSCDGIADAPSCQGHVAQGIGALGGGLGR